MPPAVAVPVGLAVASMVAQNVQNKAAIKNNENQQASAVGNAQGAYQRAQQQMNPWLQPQTEKAIARPPGSVNNPVGVITPDEVLAHMRGAPGAQTAAPPSPAQSSIAQLILQHALAGRPI